VCVCVCAVADDSLFEKVNKWPALFTGCCYCDVYASWSREAYVSIAQRWLTTEPSAVIHLAVLVVRNVS